MKIRRLLSCIVPTILLLLFNLAFAAHHEMKAIYSNIITLDVFNLTGEDGYIGTCVSPIHTDGRTLCSTPQAIAQGKTTIFIPAYRHSYVIFSSQQDDVYKCATQKDPTVQRYFIIDKDKSRHYTITLHGFIFDNDGNKVALQCELPT